MASNILPTNAYQLIGLGGITSLGTTLPVSLVTPQSFGAAWQGFITQNDGFNAQRSARQMASIAFQSEMEKVCINGCWV